MTKKQITDVQGLTSFLALVAVLWVGTIGYTAYAEMSLQEIVDLVNFSRNTIDDGELRVAYFHSPRQLDRLPEHVAMHQAKVMLKREKFAYEQAKKGRKVEPDENQRNLALMESYFLEDYVQYLAKGKAAYEEQNIAFQVKPDVDDREPTQGIIYRLYRADRYEEYEHAELRDNRYLQQYMPSSVGYHDLMVVNDEYRVILSSSVEGVSHATVESAAASRIWIPFNLMGRSYFPINPERIIAHRWENNGSHRYYIIEHEPKLNKDIRAIASDVQRGSVKIWLDPSKDYCVVREEVYLHTNRGKVKIHKVSYTDFREHPGGIRYPTRISGTSYLLHEPGKCDMCYHYVVREAHFNIGMPSDFFDLDIREVFSTGLRVSM